MVLLDWRVGDQVVFPSKAHRTNLVVRGANEVTPILAGGPVKWSGCLTNLVNDVMLEIFRTRVRLPAPPPTIYYYAETI